MDEESVEVQPPIPKIPACAIHWINMEALYSAEEWSISEVSFGRRYQIAIMLDFVHFDGDECLAHLYTCIHRSSGYAMCLFVLCILIRQVLP